jgi:hypothetical protein
MPSETSLALSSRRSRAFFNPTSGYTPSEIRFSLPAKRYLKRHQAAPGRRDLKIQAAAVEQADGFLLSGGILNFRG